MIPANIFVAPNIPTITAIAFPPITSGMAIAAYKQPAPIASLTIWSSVCRFRLKAIFVSLCLILIYIGVKVFFLRCKRPFYSPVLHISSLFLLKMCCCTGLFSGRAHSLFKSMSYEYLFVCSMFTSWNSSIFGY